MQYDKKYFILNILKFLAYTILPLLFWISVTFSFDLPYLAILTVLTALLHECGHMLAILIISRKSSLPLSNINGFKIVLKERLSYKEHIFVLLMGPLSNLIVFFISLIGYSLGCDYLMSFGFINLFTALSNLMPIEGYDGYGIVKEILCYKNYHDKVKILEGLSFSISIAFTFLALYFLLKVNSGYWLFAVFFINTLSKIKKMTEN